jgi:hypothetical protein
MADPTAGEVGGVFAGAVALVIALGHGLRWWLGWTDRRAATRSAKLDAWQHELQQREARFEIQQAEHWARVESELEIVKRQYSALLGGYQLIAAALRIIDPENDALSRADNLLRSAFLVDPVMPTEMATKLQHIHRSDETD